MNATVDPFELQLDPPLRTGRETLSTRRGFLFRVDNGAGIGAATPLVPFTESLEECQRTLEEAATAYEKAGWPGAFRVVSEISEGRLRYPAGRHAVSLAALDLQAKQQNMPLYQMLGGRGNPTVPVNATIGDGSPTATAAAARSAQQSGFPAVKVKVGAGSVERDGRRLQAVRDRVGPDLELRADANGAWEPAEATQFLSSVEDIGLAYVEQPLPVEDTAAHQGLREHRTPIALDESLVERSVPELLRENIADVYVLKPTAVGGIDSARGMATRIQRAGAETVVTSIFESVVGRTAAVHLAASLDGLPPSGLATADRFETDLGPDPAPVRNGAISAPSEPGLGIEEVGTDG
jgi:o-succinylbenzoate synthase